MTAISVSGYGLGYNSTHPFIKLNKELIKDGLNLAEYSLPNPGSPVLSECVDFMKSILISNRTAEIYLHSLAVNVFLLTVNKLTLEERKLVKENLNLIFCITPGVGKDVAKNHFSLLSEFYSLENNSYNNWDAVIDMSKTRPIIVTSADDKYLNLGDVYDLKNYHLKQEESPFIWVNLPIGNAHFNHSGDANTLDKSIQLLIKIRTKLK
jgi:hypothetical protein